MRKVKADWKSKSFGLDVDATEKLTNLRFADDLLLTGKSLHQVSKMLADLIEEAAKHGLEVHPDKTKIMWNGQGRGTSKKNITINGQNFEVLPPSGTTDYLGRAFTFTDTHDVELQNRITKAWRKFAMFRDELTDKNYPLGQRIRLFKCVIQPSILYGCVSWVMTIARERLLRSTQRKMMRTILGRRRYTSINDDNNEEADMEPWVDWIRRVTHEAEERLQQYNVPCWVEEVRRRRFRWAGHVAQRSDGRWTSTVLEWRPQGTRARGRPTLRWIDSIRAFFQALLGDKTDDNEWKTFARDRTAWQHLEEDFASRSWS